jgi:membrane protease YdiL (CAAX protease family)
LRVGRHGKDGAETGLQTFMDYAQRGRNDGWRYLLASAGGLLIAAVAILLLGAGLMIARLLPPDLATSMLSPARPAVFFGANGVVFGLLMVGFAAAVRLLQGKRFGDLLGHWSWRAFGIGAAVWTLVLCLLTLIDFAIAPSTFRWSGKAATITLAGWALPALAVQTFAEEFIFRGYVTQGLLLATRRPLAASVLSGAVFGLVHIPNGPAQAANAFVLGVMLSLIAIRTGGLGFGWGLHLANNLFGSIVVVSGLDVFHGSHGLMTQTAPQLLWFDAVLGSLAIAAIAAIVAVRWPRGAPIPAMGQSPPGSR